MPASAVPPGFQVMHYLEQRVKRSGRTENDARSKFTIIERGKGCREVMNRLQIDLISIILIGPGSGSEVSHFQY